METRRTARVLLLDPNNRILLMRIVDSRLPIGDPGRDPGLWITIGGGVKADEDVQDAANREVYEETGQSVKVGPPRWYGEQTLPVHGLPCFLREMFFVAHTDEYSIDQTNLEEDERSVIREYRRWTAEDLSATTEPSVPPILPELLREVTVDPALQSGPPRTINLKSPEG